MAGKLDEVIASSSGKEEDQVPEVEVVKRFIDPAIGSIINNILFGYRFDGVLFFIHFQHFF
jgi:hypothetical protein